MTKNNNSGKRSRAKRKRNTPQPGEEGYLTPTQLRNARKRRAVKRRRQGKPDSDQPASSTNDATIIGNDPSCLYLTNPKSAPIVSMAKQFCLEKMKNNNDSSTRSSFPIFLNTPARGWRTMAKLAVRSQKQETATNAGVLTIGMFAPQSHTILSSSKSPVHHPSINSAIEVLQALGRREHITPFDEMTGTGYWRYVALQVEHSTGRVQITLIWNNHSDDKTGRRQDEEGREQLNRLSKAILDACCKNKDDNLNDDLKSKNCGKKKKKRKKKVIHLHSLWVHYNASWKHCNSIFDTTAKPPSNDESSTTGATAKKNEGDDNFDLGPQWQKIHGPTFVKEKLTLERIDQEACNNGDDNTGTNKKRESFDFDNKVQLHFLPCVFRQANLGGFAWIISSIRQFLRSNNLDATNNHQRNDLLPRCVELYGGVGTIGLHLLDLVSSLVSSDENPYNQMCFDRAVATVKDKDRNSKDNKNVQYYTKSASSMVQEEKSLLDAAQVIIVDPPRKGLDETVLSYLCRQRNQSGARVNKVLIYVSCGFQAFQRDCTALIEEGQWELRRAEGHVLFPGSNAVETLAYFTLF